MAETVAFYAPLKPPRHPRPSGDRRMARALMTALEMGGHRVELASRLRSYDRVGDAGRQERIERLGKAVAGRLIARYRTIAGEPPPDGLDHLPCLSQIAGLARARSAPGAEHSLSAGRGVLRTETGRWPVALGHRAAEAAIREADVTLAMTAVDEAGLAPLIDPPSDLRRLPPFLEPGPYRRAARARERHRRDLADRFGLAVERPWLLAVAMMRDDVKRRSYRLLADSLGHVRDRSWQLLVVGDGVARPLIESFFEGLKPERVKFAGILEESELPACYAAADLYAWPAIREAYGMALLEAQASGLPVVAGREGGVADVVRDGVTGMLTIPRDSRAFAGALAELLDHPARRSAMAVAAGQIVEREHSLKGASALLDGAMRDASTIVEMKARRTGARP